MDDRRNVVKVSVAVAVCVLVVLAAVALRPVIGYDSPNSSADPVTTPPLGPVEPVTTPSVSAPVPRGSGSGSRAVDDVNGDGYADLVFAAPVIGARSADADDADGERSAYLGVVYGSARGLDPTVRTVIEADDRRLPPLPGPGKSFHRRS